MHKVWIAGLAIALAALPARADKQPAKGFWKILVKPKATWVLHDTIGDAASKKQSITVTTYDVRKVGAADVARIHWTYDDGKDKREIGNTAAGLPTQVAVTDKGLYLFDDTADDAKITERLKGKPSRSDPPKAYRGTKQNEGRYISIRDGNVCMGEGPLPDAGECADTCDGWVCISPTEGVVEIAGTLAPSYEIYQQ